MVTWTVDDRRMGATMAEVKQLRNEIAEVEQSVLSLVRAILPLTPELRTEASDLTNEWQVKWTDGRWADADARTAVQLHRQGRPIRSRRVTAWTEVQPVAEHGPKEAVK